MAMVKWMHVSVVVLFFMAFFGHTVVSEDTSSTTATTRTTGETTTATVLSPKERNEDPSNVPERHTEDKDGQDPESAVCASSPDNEQTTNGNESTSTTNCLKHEPDLEDRSTSVVSDECGMILAMSSLPNSGWGVFSGHRKTLSRGRPLMGGDVVVQVHDLPAHASLALLLHSYWWEASETGGIYEGVTVVSHMPGIGMLANGLESAKAGHSGANVLPFPPRIDEGGLTRLQSPGAGAITHYHNYTWFVLHNRSLGDEIFVNYGSKWFQERQQKVHSNTDKEGNFLITQLPEPSSSTSTGTENELPNPDDEKDSTQWGHRPWSQLQQEGRCLDALKPGHSELLHAGRGAFVRWDVPAGHVVLPVPVIPIAKQALWVQRAKEDDNSQKDNMFEGWQLLLNYVLGHEESSTVLVPYGPMFSLINHASSNGTNRMPDKTHKSHKQKHEQTNVFPNVRLQWSNSPTLFRHREWLQNNSTHQLWTQRESGLLLELVATRDLVAGEEVLLDYGAAWDIAWKDHVREWKPPPHAESYAPSYVHDDAIVQARTEKELKGHPYPDHIFASCFFPVNETVRQHLATTTTSNSQKQKGDGSVTTIKWELTRGMFEFSNMRPCRIMERQATKYKNVFFYSVQILNRYGLRKEERLTSPLIVTHVPRKAIRLSDKIYTTDQHLPHAFRHAIGVPDDVFPEAWKDLKEKL